MLNVFEALTYFDVPLRLCDTFSKHVENKRVKRLAGSHLLELYMTLKNSLYLIDGLTDNMCGHFPHCSQFFSPPVTLNKLRKS